MRGEQHPAKVGQRVNGAPILRNDFLTSHVDSSQRAIAPHQERPPNSRLLADTWRGRDLFIPESCHTRANSFSEVSGAQVLASKWLGIACMTRADCGS